MKPTNRICQFVFVSALAAIAVVSMPSAVDGAPIPGLFNTGVGEDGKLLPASGAVDPHYTITVSPDEEFTGPDAVTLNPGFPVGPWLGEGPDSKWIVANPASGNSAEGDYTFRTSFDLTGFDSTKATITGLWSVDNSGIDILLNGESLGITNTGGFTSWTDFTIDSGFVDGENVLEFVVNNAPATPNPAGLRVELRGTVEVAGEAPSILKQPESKNIFQGEPATFTVDADGTPPLSYQWFKGDDAMDGETSSELVIDSVTLKDAAEYSVIVTNGEGSTPSDKARLAVVQALAGLFNTGIDDDGQPIENFEVDPHYVLVINPNEESTDSIVADTDIWPIVAGPWLLPSDTSKWISPTPDTNGGPGDYHYRFTFDLTGFDPATAFVAGNWSSDNAATNILINGVATGKGNGGNFGAYVEFLITDGFVEGENTLEFIVNNGGGPTGLRIDDFRGGAVAVSVPTQVVAHPRSATVFDGDDVQLSVVATGIPPITYQWRFGGEAIEGANDDTLTLSAISLDQTGDYDVVITGGQGDATSNAATLTVLSRVPGLFNTGVDDDRQPLEDFEIDPHWELVVNSDSESPDAIVLNHSAWPIIAGPWVRVSETSKWIGVREDANGVPGEYTYRTTFDLTGFDLATVTIRGQWAVDDAGTDITLNGEFLGQANGTGFGNYGSFEILGFVDGANTLEFTVVNGGDADNPTGLRLENIAAGGTRVDVAPFMIGEANRDASGLTFHWNSRIGTTYSIDFSTDLRDWQELVDGIVATSSSTSHTDTDPTRLALGSLYYRVRAN